MHRHSFPHFAFLHHCQESRSPSIPSHQSRASLFCFGSGQCGSLLFFPRHLHCAWLPFSAILLPGVVSPCLSVAKLYFSVPLLYYTFLFLCCADRIRSNQSESSPQLLCRLQIFTVALLWCTVRFLCFVYQRLAVPLHVLVFHLRALTNLCKSNQISSVALPSVSRRFQRKSHLCEAPRRFSVAWRSSSTPCFSVAMQFCAFLCTSLPISCGTYRGNSAAIPLHPKLYHCSAHLCQPMPLRCPSVIFVSVP